MSRRSERLKNKFELDGASSSSEPSSSSSVQKVDNSTNTKDALTLLKEFEEALNTCEDSSIQEMYKNVKENSTTLQASQEKLIEMKKKFEGSDCFTMRNTGMELRIEDLKKKNQLYKTEIEDRIKDVKNLLVVVEENFKKVPEVENDLNGMLLANFKCSICKEFYVEAVITNCSHTFCKYCLDRRMQKTKICSICGATITNYLRNLSTNTLLNNLLSLTDSTTLERWREIAKKRNSIAPSSSSMNIEVGRPSSSFAACSTRAVSSTQIPVSSPRAFSAFQPRPSTSQAATQLENYVIDLTDDD